MVMLLMGFLFSLSSAENAATRSSGYIIDNWTIDEGLPQNSVTKIAQTPEGYLWLATRSGLARFDGASFTTFTNRETEAIPNLPIRNLYVDKRGRLWIASQGAGIICYQNNRFTAYTTESGLMSNTVWSITEGPDGTIWIGTRNGLNYFKDGKIENFSLSGQIDPPDINALYTDREGRIWVGAINSGGSIENTSTGWKFRLRPFLNNHFINGFLVDSRKRFWFYTNTKGVFSVDGDRAISITGDPLLTTGAIFGMTEDSEGSLWVATYDNGLFRITGNGSSRLGVEAGLSTNSLFSVFEDRERNLWVGTEGGGLDRLKKARVATFTQADGMGSDSVSSVFCDSRGDLWFGSTGQGITLFSGNRFQAFSTRNGLPADSVFFFAEDRDGNLWHATYGQGVFQKTKDRYVRYQAEQGIDDPNTMVVHVDSEGAVWVGSELGNVYRKEGDRFVLKYKYDSSVECIYTDRQGDLWICTFEVGLIRIRNGRETFFNKKAGFPTDAIHFVTEDSQGRFWVSTGEGFGLFKEGRFVFRNEADGLPILPILTLVEDRGGKFWLCSRKGIFGVDREQFARFFLENTSFPDFIQLGKEDGMKSIECRGSARGGCLDHFGNIWIATQKGIAMFNPGTLKIDSTPPPVVITGIHADDRPYHPSGQVFVPPGRGRIEVSYSALTYGSPKRVFFKYRLEGYEEKWVNSGTRRTAYYTNLEPGKYRFRVQACNSDGVWNQDGAAIDLFLKPHFFQTGWFYLLSVMALSLLVFSGYRWRIRQLRQRKEELEGLVSERTVQLAESNDQLARANLELEKLATQDGLTGIANQRKFQESLIREWRQCARNKKSLAIILADVDFFKIYNDTFGHLAGDQCLKKVAKLFDRLARRPGDLAARYGGEEFILILSDTDREGAGKISESLRKDVEALAIPHQRPDKKPFLTISLGYSARFPIHDIDPYILVEEADRALYLSKRNGRNRCTFADESPQS